MQKELPLFAGLESLPADKSPSSKQRAKIDSSSTLMSPPLTNPLKKRSFSLPKERGSYYTSEIVSKFLVRWAIRSRTDTVLDPSFGGGVFLQAAGRRLSELGGNPRRQVFGIELDSDAHGKSSSTLQSDWEIPSDNLLARDFFEVEPVARRRVTAVVGNPPYIRYQRFTADVRKRALARAAEQGVALTQLSSSWAPFVIHSISMIKDGGRLAMVLPGEINYAKYAVPVLEFLTKSFGEINLFTFRKKLFSSINEDTVLLLAEDKGQTTTSIFHRDFTSEEALKDFDFERSFKVENTQVVPTSAILEKRQRLIEYLLPKKTRDLYNALKGSEHVTRLGDLTDVGIGYVTGANDFFHLSPKEAQYFRIPSRFLKNAVKRSRAFQGLEFTSRDWNSALPSGESAYLLSIDPKAELPDGVSDYLRQGQARGVAEAYKCRTRKPWYSVPHVHEADGFLSYMSTGFPTLVANHSGAVAPNTLHILRLHDSTGITPSEIATRWLTSLTRMSVEIEGHSLGGGMLKLEPSEAENCLIAAPTRPADREELCEEMDSLMRARKNSTATELADKSLLQDILGLSARDCRLLLDGANLLMSRRMNRNVRA